MATAAFYLVYQQVENYVIQPRVMGRTIEMSAPVIILAVLIGGSLLGVIGAILAIPVAAIPAATAPAADTPAAPASAPRAARLPSSRATSTALYAAMPPETPRSTRAPRRAPASTGVAAVT